MASAVILSACVDMEVDARSLNSSGAESPRRPGMAQIEVKVKLDLPVGVELLGYERCGDRARLRG